VSRLSCALRCMHVDKYMDGYRERERGGGVEREREMEREKESDGRVRRLYLLFQLQRRRMVYTGRHIGRGFKCSWLFLLPVQRLPLMLTEMAATCDVVTQAPAVATSPAAF
jgi:hypothetical protein